MYCLDVDECNEGLENCDHNCTNVDGSFECSCRHGFRLAPDGHSCFGLSDVLHFRLTHKFLLVCRHKRVRRSKQQWKCVSDYWPVVH